MGPLATQAEHRADRGIAHRVCAVTALALVAWLLSTLPSVAPADAQSRQFYGVAAQAPQQAGPLQPDDYRRMQAGGVGTLRFLIAWGNVEREPGVYRWAEPDGVIGNAAARGIRLLPYVKGPPRHVKSPPTQRADRRAFRRFMAALTRRYGYGGEFWRGSYPQRFGSGATPRPVRTWQIFNEQNGPFFWEGRPSPRAYGQLVKMGARGVRRHNPRAEIVLGGMFATPSGAGGITSWNYLRRLYRVRGIKRFFDTVAVHPYAPSLRGVRIQMRRIRNVMRRNNDRAGRIRVTELGWGSQPNGHPLTKTPQGQARMLRRSFRLMARQRHRRNWNVRGMTWFSWQDGGGCPFCDSSGLLGGAPGNRTAKPSWGAFRRVAGG